MTPVGWSKSWVLTDRQGLNLMPGFDGIFSSWQGRWVRRDQLWGTVGVYLQTEATGGIGKRKPNVEE